MESFGNQIRLEDEAIAADCSVTAAQQAIMNRKSAWAYAR